MIKMKNLKQKRGKKFNVCLFEHLKLDII